MPKELTHFNSSYFNSYIELTLIRNYFSENTYNNAKELTEYKFGQLFCFLLIMSYQDNFWFSNFSCTLFRAKSTSMTCTFTY